MKGIPWVYFVYHNLIQCKFHVLVSYEVNFPAITDTRSKSVFDFTNFHPKLDEWEFFRINAKERRTVIWILSNRFPTQHSINNFNLY